MKKTYVLCIMIRDYHLISLWGSKIFCCVEVPTKMNNVRPEAEREERRVEAEKKGKGLEEERRLEEKK